jgi:GT2 family glycosyltransferase
MKKVSVLIANTNSCSVLRECLKNLDELVHKKKQNLEVIVTDNNSNDGSSEMVKKEFPWVKLQSTPNYGLANCCVLGADAATGDYLLFLGEDGFPKEKAIPGLIKYMDEHPEVGLATARLVLRDGSPDMDVHRRFPTPWSSFARLFMLSKIFPKSKLFNSYFMIDQDHSKEHEIEMCITHFMFIPRHIYDEVEGFDHKNYFVFGEDADICYKIKRSGYKLMYLPQFEAGHYKGISFGIRKETQDISVKSLAWKNFIHLNRSRAMRVFVKKFYRDKYPTPMIWFMILGSYVLQIQRQASEVYKHIKRHGFTAFNDDYTKDSRARLKERFGF